MTDAKIKELQGQVLALREAASKIRHWHDTGSDGMIVSADSVRELWEALTDTAQAGRDAEARIIDETLTRLGLGEPKMMKILSEHMHRSAVNRRVAYDDSRLRNGGSDE